MSDIFASGYLIDLVLIVVVVEAAALLLVWCQSRRGIAPGDLLPNLCAGAFLLLALRATLGGAGWMIACLCLAGAGIAHLTDVWRRWRS
jgi:hypothetical protein